MTDSPKQIAPYGSWPSPISTTALTAATISLSETRLDRDSIYWLENRPEEKGRTTIVQYQNGQRRDILPKPLNARSKVNEYGGGAYCVQDGVVYFVLFDDQRIYKVDTDQNKATPEAITAPSQNRYADLIIDSTRERLIAVAEDHSNPDQEAQTSLICIDLKNSNGQQQPITLHSGCDFYANPKISPDGKYLLWLSWNHPDMPWDNTQCWLASFNEQGNLSNANVIAGDNHDSIVQPQFSPAGDIFLVSDKNNWWNLYSYRNGKTENLLPMSAEFAGPQWVFGQSFYSFVDAENIVGTFSLGGSWQLYRFNLSTRSLTTIPSPCADIAYVQANADHTVFIGAGKETYNAVYQLTGSDLVSTLVEPVMCDFDSGNVAKAQAIEFPLLDSDDVGHAFYYPPTNKHYCGPDNQAPPLLVFCHGGPTSATHSSLNLKIQYWTSRGIAVADVNYRGSTGFGRQYRDALKGQWGIVDVQDCIDCVNFLVSCDLADKTKVAIRGGSAGGYTVLCALTFHDIFKAGASYYGVSDLELLATDTHKFESRYLDSLVGPYPQQQQLYRERSPIHHLDKLQCPVIFLQGLQDKVVPPNQAGVMVEALDKKGIPHAYITFEEEGHGFRQAPNQRRALEVELYFYSRVFGFPLADNIEPIPIQHLRHS